MSQKFKKIVEDFVCEHCGAQISGNGYTNHCPRCLWSKHVDNFPGDRENKCLGMMSPQSVLYEGGEYILIHQCEKCGIEKRNKIAPGDDMDLVSKI